MRGVCLQVGGPFPGYDVVFLARPKVADAPFDTLVEHTAAALAKAQISTTQHVR